MWSHGINSIPTNGKYQGATRREGRDRGPKNTACPVCPSAPRVRKRSGLREMAAAEAAAAATTPAEGYVIPIHSLDEWSIRIDEANSAKKLVVIDFTASWCPPCRIMAPIFADMAKKFPNVVFLKVDVDEMKTIAEQFSVEAMPTFLFMKEGDVKDRVVGAAKEDLANKLQLHMTQ